MTNVSEEATGSLRNNLNPRLLIVNKAKNNKEKNACILGNAVPAGVKIEVKSIIHVMKNDQ